MRHLLIVLVSLVYFSGNHLLAQDVIHTVSGRTIQCEVREVGSTSITYRELEGGGSTIRIIPRSDVGRIVYGDGSILVVTPGAAENPESASGTPWSGPDKLYTTDGRLIIGEVMERKRFGLNIVPQDDPTGTPIYVPYNKIARIESPDGQIEYIQQKAPRETRREERKDFTYLSPNYISFFTGPALPMGNFGDQSGVNAGHARPGLSTSLDITGYVFRGTGFSLVTGYSFFPVQNPGLRQTLETYIATEYESQVTGTQVNGWQFAHAMAGLGYFTEHGRLMVDVRWFMGFLHVWAPRYTLNYTRQDGIADASTFYRPDQSLFGMGGSIQMRFFITRKWQVRGGLNLMTAEARFEPMIEEIRNSGSQKVPSLGAGIVTHNLGWLSIDFGLAYTLGK
jgi:hypothetical protein